MDLFNAKKEVVVKKKRILLLIDVYNWSFHNIAQRLQKNLTKYEIDILKTAQFYRDAKKLVKNNYDIFVFFYPSGKFNSDEINFLKQYNNSKIYWCLYENFIWRDINNIPELQGAKNAVKTNINYWMENGDGYFYGSPKIKENLKELTSSRKMLDSNNRTQSCMDGVDTRMFYFKQYNKDILTKKKLRVGWIGNSDVGQSGIQKGYIEIKQYVSDLSANFDFCPLDRVIKQIPHNEVPNYIHNIDIIVCYSTAEGTPNQILEGSSCGRCWVSTDVGVVSPVYNTIVNNPTGIIIKKNEKAFKEALMKLYNNRELIVEYGRNGRKAINVKWDWKYRLEGFEKMFELH
jgi:glycosyltransferase involved in cell wall biosynthesis